MKPNSNKPQKSFIDHERKKGKTAVNGCARIRAHLACGFSLAQINRMQLAASGSGQCLPATNAIGARLVSTGRSVNQTVTVFATAIAERSCPTRCWTGAGFSSPDRFAHAVQHAGCCSQQDFAHTFALASHPRGIATAGPAAMLRSIARIASNFMTPDGFIGDRTARTPSRFGFRLSN
jgi:hypothetical protein